MSPILVRPVREQLEHDRVIRLLQAKWKKRYEVEVNLGDERNASVQVGSAVLYPDLVLKSASGARRLQGVVEVETAESVNNLEAMAQWAHMGRAGVPFHLYVPQQSVDIARRLCEEQRVGVAELWTYMPLGDQLRFTLVQSNPELAEVQAGGPSAKGVARGGGEAESTAAAAEAGEAAPAQAVASPPRKPKPARAVAARKPAREAARSAKSAAAARASRPSQRAASRASARRAPKPRPARSASSTRKAATSRGATKARTPGSAPAGRRAGKSPKAGKTARSARKK